MASPQDENRHASAAADSSVERAGKDKKKSSHKKGKKSKSVENVHKLVVKGDELHEIPVVETQKMGNDDSTRAATSATSDKPVSELDTEASKKKLKSQKDSREKAKKKRKHESQEPEVATVADAEEMPRKKKKKMDSAQPTDAEPEPMSAEPTIRQPNRKERRQAAQKELGAENFAREAYLTKDQKKGPSAEDRKSKKGKKGKHESHVDTGLNDELGSSRDDVRSADKTKEKKLPTKEAFSPELGVPITGVSPDVNLDADDHASSQPPADTGLSAKEPPKKKHHRKAELAASVSVPLEESAQREIQNGKHENMNSEPELSAIASAPSGDSTKQGKRKHRDQGSKKKTEASEPKENVAPVTNEKPTAKETKIQSSKKKKTKEAIDQEESMVTTGKKRDKGRHGLASEAASSSAAGPDNWNVAALAGGEARQAKMLKLLGGGKHQTGKPGIV